MKSFDALLDEQMEDPEFRKEYVRLMDEARSRAIARADIAEARLAAVEALADEWEAGRRDNPAPTYADAGRYGAAMRLRAALATGATNQQEADQGG